MAKEWIQALKQLNKGKKSWCIPKKNSANYDKVVEIHKKLKAKGK
jgi:hypothetical protein